MLDLDPQEILRAYDEHFVDQEPTSLEYLDAAKKAEKHPPRPRWLLTAAFALALLLAIGAVGLLHGPGEKIATKLALQPLPPRYAGRQAASRASNDALIETRSRHVAAGTITIALSVTDRCWVRIVADGKTILAEALAKGTARTFSATRTLQISVGKPAVLNLSFNGTPVTLPHATATGLWQGTFGPQGLL